SFDSSSETSRIVLSGVVHIRTAVVPTTSWRPSSMPFRASPGGGTSPGSKSPVVSSASFPASSIATSRRRYFFPWKRWARRSARPALLWRGTATNHVRPASDEYSILTTSLSRPVSLSDAVHSTSQPPFSQVLPPDGSAKLFTARSGLVVSTVTTKIGRAH